MESDRKTQKAGNPLKVHLVKEGNVVVVSIPGARKVTLEETNEWVRKIRDCEV
jgi:hypothetical protein